MKHCPLTYNSVVLLPDDGDNHDILPCCLYRGNIRLKTDDIENEYLHGEMDTLRKRLDSGERVDECHECWVKEDVGVKSMRQKSIEHYGVLTEPKLTFMEFELDNTCNLKCNICSSGRSTAWIKEEINLFGRASSPAYNTTLYKNVDFSKLDTIKLIGGEPLLSKNITDICNRVKESGELENLKVVGSTNGTLIPNGVVEDVFLNCKYLDLNISIDAVEGLFEFIRIGAEWNKVKENLKYFHDLYDNRKGETNIVIHCVVTPYNVNYLHLLDKFLDENFPKFTRSKDALITPDFMSLIAMPTDYKEYVKSYLLEYGYNDLLGYMEQDSKNLFNYFVAWHKKLLKVTNADFEKLNPKLNELINNYDYIPVVDELLLQKKEAF